MRTRLRSKISLLCMTFGLLLAIPAVALADNIQNDIDTTNNADSVVNAEVGETVTVGYRIQATGAGGTDCDAADGSKATLTPAKESGPGTITVSPTSRGYTSCGSFQYFDFTADTAGDYVIAVSASDTSGSYNASPAKWKLHVTSSDRDSDGVADSEDNCPDAANANQADADGDGQGDACDSDRDGDGVNNATDNCPDATNANQADADADGQGDVCDSTPLPANRAPTVQNAAADANGDEGDTLQTNGSFSDLDNDSLSITKSSGAGTVQGNANGTWSWSLATNDDTSGSVEVTADDGHNHTVTDTFTYSAANVAPTATFNFPAAAIDEGDPFSLSLTNVQDPGSADTFTFAFDCGAGYEAFGASHSANCSTDDNGTLTVKGTVKDDDNGSTGYTGTVQVDNVPPTIQSITASAQNALTGKNVTFTGSATDPSNADTTFGFYWKWAVDGGAFGNYGLVKVDTYTTSFSTCGSHYVSAQAKDKDDGESVVFSTNSNPVQVLDGSFRPPVDAAPYVNTVQKGRVIPVKISVTCNGNIANLSPSIQLLSGDKSTGSETQADEIETLSVSAADTTGIMRAVDGGYIYNLQVPSNATANQLFTIRVNPFGGSNASSNMYAVLKIRK